MRKRFISALLSAVLCCVLLSLSVLSSSALDDKYVMEELGMSIKIPKEYTVITRESEREDEAFSTLSLDYDETMTAFSAAHIYLQAVSDQQILKVTLTMTTDENSKAVNNYSELSSAQRVAVLDAFLESDNYSSGVEIKHNGNIYFDFAFTQSKGDNAVYGYQCHTVINGMNLNLTLQKSEEELTADEIKVVTNMANSIKFDKIKSSKGPSLDWWRVLLWVLILFVIGYLAQYFYRQYNEKRVQKLKDRKQRKITADSTTDYDDNAHAKPDTIPRESKRTLLSALGFENDLADDSELSFDELLGYDTTGFKERANTDMDEFDINVQGKDRSHGVNFFEDEGDTIDDKPDYFDNYFREKTESRPWYLRALSAVWLNIRLSVLHLKYFFKNLYTLIVSEDKNKRNGK